MSCPGSSLTNLIVTFFPILNFDFAILIKSSEILLLLRFKLDPIL